MIAAVTPDRFRWRQEVPPTKPRLLVTGASDDDPSGIATYSQAGARFGFGLTWTMLFTYPDERDPDDQRADRANDPRPDGETPAQEAVA